jgi:hypothetical protein
MCNNNNFCGNSGGFSAERLVEFGMGMSLARQFTRMMDETMSETLRGAPRSGPQYPGQLSSQPSTLYYAALNGKQAGPFSETEIVRLVNEGTITKDSLVWHQGMKEWKAAVDVPEILRIIALAPPPMP